jgi:glycosyltransferase involved in cell wall biosynthesis
LSGARVPRIVCEGWRFLPQSFALVNQFQILALLDMGASVAVRDRPYWGDWAAVYGILPAACEARLKALTAPAVVPDAVIRVAVPFDFTATPGVPTLVMATAESGRVRPESVAGNVPIGDAVAASDALVHAPSRWSRDGLIASGVPGERITVIGHGVDPTLWRPSDPAPRSELRRRFGWADDFVFLNIGAMTGNKGIDLLLAGFAALLETCPNARLVLKGMDAIFRSRAFVAEILNALPASHRARVAERLTYIGGSLPLVDMVRLYQAADAYVSPYRGEGFNMPVLEAAACGLPVVCTDGGATDDFTTPDFALKVDAAFDPDRRILEPSPAHLVAQLRRCMEDEPWFRAACRAGPAHVAKRHTWRHTAVALLRAIAPDGDGARDVDIDREEGK